MSDAQKIPTHHGYGPYSWALYKRVKDAELPDGAKVIAWELCNSFQRCKCAVQCREAVIATPPAAPKEPT